MFAADRGDWRKTFSVRLNGGVCGAYMLQDEHYCFARGRNHFSIAALDAGGGSKTVLEGEECGDWAALLGDHAGLMVACRDAADSSA